MAEYKILDTNFLSISAQRAYACIWYDLVSFLPFFISLLDPVLYFTFFTPMFWILMMLSSSHSHYNGCSFVASETLAMHGFPTPPTLKQKSTNSVIPMFCWLQTSQHTGWCWNNYHRKLAITIGPDISNKLQTIRSSTWSQAPGQIVTTLWRL